MDEDSEDEEVPDPPEPFVNGVIDLGRLATDALFLAIDPYPRRPDAVFEPLAEVKDPAAHPFAALKTLQSGEQTAAAKKVAKKVTKKKAVKKTAKKAKKAKASAKRGNAMSRARAVVKRVVRRVLRKKSARGRRRR